MIARELQGLTIHLPKKITDFVKNEKIENRFTNNRYEAEEIYLICKYLQSDDIVLELGASIGGTSCVINNSLTNKTNMVSVEANPDVMYVLENNRNINNLKFNIKHGAVSWENKKIKFNYGCGFLGGSILYKTWLEKYSKQTKQGEYKNIELTTLTPLDIEKEYNLKFNFLSCDIEGEEYNLLYNLFDYFNQYRCIMVEFHSWAETTSLNRNYIENMYKQNFLIERKGQSTIFYKKN